MCYCRIYGTYLKFFPREILGGCFKCQKDGGVYMRCYVVSGFDPNGS